MMPGQTAIGQTTKSAFVTGGANGLGKGFVKALLAEGYVVHVVDRDEAGLQQMHHDLSGELMTYVLDLSDADAVADQIERYCRAGPFDLVVLNAGISATGQFEKIPATAHQRLLAVNTIAPMIMANRLTANRAMRENAKLAFISSLSFVTGYPGAASYAASKDTIAIYAKSIRKPLAKLGIKVSCVFPGPIRTEHADRHSPPDAKAEKRADPDELAIQILNKIRAGKTSIYIGLAAKAARSIGWIAPGFVTNLMRKALFEKLDREVY